jgi:tetratricopeptide (TPR) repeat protein
MIYVVAALVFVIGISIVVIVAGAVAAKKRDRLHTTKKIRSNRDRSKVLKDANRRLAANPKDAEALQALGTIYFDEQNWEKAFKMFETLSDYAAGNPEYDEFDISMKLGLAALRLGREEEAYKALLFARTMKADNFEVNFNLGYLEFQRKQYEKAALLLRQATKQNIEHPMALRYLGHSLFRTKLYKEALVALKRAVDLAPDDKESLFTMGECFYEIGQQDQAIKIFTHLRTDPTLGASAALFAGTIHMNQHQQTKAILDFEIGLKHQGTKIETLVELKYRLAAAYLKEQEIAKAVTLLQEVQGMFPNYKDVPAQLAKYKELNQNHNLQTYLISPASEFVMLCRRIVGSFFPKAKVKIVDISSERADYTDMQAEVETSKWQDMILFRFFRSNGSIGEFAVRDFHARLKDVKAGKGYCICAGTYTDEARKFVEARLIDLIEKPQLMHLLNKIDARARGLAEM